LDFIIPPLERQGTNKYQGLRSRGRADCGEMGAGRKKEQEKKMRPPFAKNS
jgi:hypothetical protein